MQSALSSDGFSRSGVQDIETMLRRYARARGVTLKEAFDEAMLRVREFEDGDQGRIAFSE